METSHPLSKVLAALRAHQSPSGELHLPAKPSDSSSLVPPRSPLTSASAINFDRLHNNHRSAERSEMIAPRPLPTGVGLLVEERLRFVLSGVDSSCGLTIHRLGGDNERILVIFSADEHSYGMHVANAREHLAMAITARYQLNPMETIWVERYPEDTSPGAHRAKEEFWRIAFGSFNPRTGVFKHAGSKRFETLANLLQESAQST